MTPQEAGDLLNWQKGREAARRRYVLEGGTRQAWKCADLCGCWTEAETETEARENLTRFGKTHLRAGLCFHRIIIATGHIMPPLDFS